MSIGQSPTDYHILESGEVGAQIYFPIGTIPALGFGTWQAKGDEGEKAVHEAIRAGFRHIDCAEAYQNHETIGRGIRRALDEMKGELRRSDLFICSKLWNTHHDPRLVEPVLRRALTHLQVEYLDLYLMHWPVAFEQRGDELFPKDANGHYAEDTSIPLIDTWRAMEDLLMKGLVKHIGVSNFTVQQMEELWRQSRIRPVTNQLECHPYLDQKETQQWMKDHGMIFESYSPLGQQGEGHPDLLKDDVVLEVAKKHKKTPAQILLRWHVDSGRVVLTKSTSIERIKENFAIWDFKLSGDELKQLDALGKKNMRTCNPRFKQGGKPVFDDAPASEADD